MKNKQAITYRWAYLPFVFSSAAILATAASATPGASQQYQDARQVGSANYEYVGGRTQIGFGVTDQGDVSVDLNQVISETENSSTSAGLWAGYELKGDNKGIKGRGIQLNHNWVSRDASGRATHVNKVFGAYDKNEAGHSKATVGYGQENESLFWEGHVSKGLSDKKNARVINGKTVSDKAYDYGVGGSVGTFLKDSNMRVRAGLDHEWGNDLGEGESTAKNTTLSAGIEKFFQGTPHSLGLDVAASKRSGGYGNDSSDTNVTGKLSYRYDFGGASIYQPDRRYRRVRVEVPGTAVAPRYSKKAQYKRVPTYKTVTTYGKKTIRKPYKQLVKSTMELEGQTFFKLNSARLIPSAKARLQEIATQIRKNGYKGSIRITGNTCGLGDAAYDQRLSEQRANAVKNFLIENGFNPDHLVARGLGKGHPKYPNTPDQGFKNRRVDIEYVTERQTYKTGYRTEQVKVRTGTRRVVTGFKNVPAGYNNVLIDNGRPGTPRVIWKTEVIPSSPAWIRRALHNNIKHNTSVNTYQTTAGSAGGSVKALNDTAITDQGKAVTIDVLSNDDQDAILTRVVTQPRNGTARIVNGQIVYTPNAGFTGTDTFTYEVKDPQGNTTTASVRVTVKDTVVNAANDLASTDQGKAVTVDVLNNDDPDATLTRVVTQPSNGTARIVNGKIVYTPNAGFTGTDTFTYEVKDPKGNTKTATVSVTVKASGINAEDDVASTTQGQAVTIDVLANDDSDASLTGVLTQPAHGSVRIVNGQVLYTPNAGFTGADSFTYEVTDPQGNKTTATVRVNVGSQGGSVNAADDTASTSQGQSVSINVLANDDSDAALTGVFTQPANGSVRIVNGQIVYTPKAGFTGTDAFIYEVKDPQGNKTTATVYVTVVGQGVVNAADDRVSTPQGQAVTIDVLNNDDSDATLTGTLSQPSNGTASIVNGQIVYQPNTGFSGTDTFTYEVTDPQGNKTTARVTVVVGQGSIYAGNDRASTSQGQAVTIDVLNNDDSDATLTGTLSQPSNGTASIVNGQIVYQPDAGFSGTDSFTYEVTDPQGNKTTATVTVVVGQGSINAGDDSASTPQGQAVTIDVLNNDDFDATLTGTLSQPSNGTASIVNGQIVYQPNAGFSGTDSFTYEVTDPQGNKTTATVTVIVQGSIVAGNDTATTPQGQAVTIDVLNNDDSDVILSGALTQPVHGSASIVNGQIVYTPNAGFTGTDSFTYEVIDPQGNTTTAIVTVIVQDTGVMSADDTDTTDQGQPVTIDVLSNDDSDATLTGTLTQPSHGTAKISNGMIVYTPMAGFTGTDSFTYEVTDPQGNKSTSKVTVTVNPTSGGFSAEDDTAVVTGSDTSVTIDVMNNDNGAVRITRITGVPDHGTASIVNGKIVYTPEAGFSGTDYFNYEVEDANGNTDIATVVVTVSGSTTATVATDDNATTDCSAVTINVLDNDTGTGTLSIIGVGSAGLGNAVISGNTIVYTPSDSCKTGNTGADSFTYTIKDGQGNTATGTVNVSVKGCNICIKAEPDDAMTTSGQAVTIDVLDNDSGQGLSIVSVDMPKNGTAEVVGNSIRYTPNTGFTGNDSFWYDIVDANGNNEAALIIVYVGND